MKFRTTDVYEALRPPLDVEKLLAEVPELGLARGLGQGPFHHLDTLDHILETVRGVDRELRENRVGARVQPENHDGLRLAGLLHDVAKPVTRGEHEGRVMFVAHDTLGARLARQVCGRLEVSADITDLVVTLTALHLKIGFMTNERSDYPPERLVRAAGPFGEELAVITWSDRLAAQGPRLKPEHLERHRELCTDFLHAYRASGPYETPDYDRIAQRIGSNGTDAGADAGASAGASAGYAASRMRLLGSRGLSEAAALEQVARQA